MGFNQVLLTSCFLLAQFAWGQIYEFTTPTRLGTTINTSADESNPVISSNGNTLYFVRTFDPKNTGGIYDQDIWYCKKTMAGWGPTFSLKALNNKLNNAVIAETEEELDSTRQRLYLISSYGVERDVEKGITMASRSILDTQWVIQNKLPIPSLNIDGKYVSYTLSNDQQVVIISYEGSDSEGEEDLYYSLKEPDGWSEPEHLGAAVNTPGFEISPFLSLANDTLYFSSNGFKGFGDADIFYSVRKGKWSSWSKPVNLGKTINTPFFDAYFSITHNCALWSSNREGKDLDLWTAWAIAPPELLITVNEIKHASEFQGADGKIDIDVVSGVKPYKFLWSNGMTTADISSLQKGEYKLQITDSIGQKISRVFTIDEPEATEQRMIRFPNIQYEFNKWTFVNDSIINTNDSLRLVAKLLEDYPNLMIELISHTDSRGEESRNLILSKNRAKACYISLVNEFKIDPRRIIPVGKGEAEPASWYDPELQQMVLLSEEYIQTKKNNEGLFEYLNQLNRRTEGKVLRLDFNPNNAPEAPKSYLEFQAMPK
jgi:outer membrane protein OmpA-like peptidoglycan-associated protein